MKSTGAPPSILKLQSFFIGTKKKKKPSFSPAYITFLSPTEPASIDFRLSAVPRRREIGWEPLVHAAAEPTQGGAVPPCPLCLRVVP